MTESQHLMSVPKVLTFVLVTLCVFLACRANLQPNNAKNIEDFIMGWGDKIFSAVKKFDEFIDFEKLNQIIDATIEEDCFPEDCPLGTVSRPNPSVTPESNGCGSFGIQWKKEFLPDEGLENCCNTHDYCYDTCGADRDRCDFEFKSCLYKICNSHTTWTRNEMKACKGTAKLMYTATQAFGCKAYLDAQKNACICVGVHEEL